MAEDLPGSHDLLPDSEKKKLKLGKQEVFKFLYPDLEELAKDRPMVVVRNKDNTWVGAMPFTEELKTLFYGSPHFYVKAVPQASGQLHIMAFIGNQGW